VQSWLDILAALARAQATVGVIPDWAATEITACAEADDLDVELIARRTRETAHSTLGLIEAFALLLPERSRQYVYYGITVQDLTDTWAALLMRDAGALIRADLLVARSAAARLAAEHRNTPMAGRTHGQPGSPITFGLKAATWADELDRCIDRIDQGQQRWATVQLAGSTGTLAFFADTGPALRAAFASELDLADPGISWTSTRDRVAEFGTVMSLASGCLGRIGDEVYELQRPEIAELAEPSSDSAVGSITMPHKRNPEYSEHLSTLARLVRASASVLVEGLVSSHERDGRSWKAEWAALPDVALYSSRAAALAADLLEGLHVDSTAMQHNLGSGSASEALLIGLSQHVGKHRAQALLQVTLRDQTPDQAVGEIAKAAGLAESEVRKWLATPCLGSSGAMVDHVVSATETAR